MFTGRRLDVETRSGAFSGLYDYRARIYSPDLGRFLQPDPIGYADDLNMYAYCGNNPLGFVDPMGLLRYNHINPAQLFDVLFAAGPYDALIANTYKNIDYGRKENGSDGLASTLTNLIAITSPTSMTDNQEKQIENALLHVLYSAHLYRNMSEEDASHILDIHEKYSPMSEMTDSIKDQKNNAIGRRIGLSDADIISATMDAYYRGEVYGLYQTGFGMHGIEKIHPVTSLSDLVSELQSLSNELKRASNLLNVTGNSKSCP